MKKYIKTILSTALALAVPAAFLLSGIVISSANTTAAAGSQTTNTNIEKTAASVNSDQAGTDTTPSSHIQQDNGAAPAPLSIVCTIFPEYDWVTQILGADKDTADITLLLGNGVDLHSYQPTAKDIMKVSSCDIFIYVGGESDAWVENALKEAVNKDMVVINLLDVLGETVKEEETVEGMQTEGAGEALADFLGQEEETEYDEHVWLSLKNAEILIPYMEEQLAAALPEHKSTFQTNTDNYLAQLDELDQKYQDIVASAKFHTLLFGDRFPFRYLVDDYGLDYYAAFPGCSAETEASFETITFLSGKVDELGLTSIMTMEGTDHKIADTIIQNTTDKDQTVRTLNSMQATTTEDIENGTTYLSLMEENLQVLADALN